MLAAAIVTSAATRIARDTSQFGAVGRARDVESTLRVGVTETRAAVASASAS